MKPDWAILRVRLRSYLRATTIVEVLPLRTIIPSLYPIREDLGNIEELTRSVKRRGLLEPIIVRPVKSKFEIIAGHRRYMACRLIGFSEIPAIVLDLSDKEAFEVSLEENLHRRTLDPMEEARAFKVYVDRFGYGSTTELANRIGKSEEYVSHRIALLSLPEQVQEQVRRRLLTSSDAWEISRVKDRSKQEKLASVAVEGKLTVRQLRSAANLLSGGVPIEKALRQVRDEIPSFLASHSSPSWLKESRVKKSASTLLRIALIRLDNLINEVDQGNNNRLREELFKLRFSLHELIDQFLQEGHDDSTISREVIAFLREKYVKSVNIKDISAISGIRDEREFTQFDDFPPLELMDFKTAKEHSTRIFKTTNESNCDIENVRVTSLGDVAIATFTFRYDLIARGAPYSSKSRVTIVLKKLGGAWRILHEHWSQANYEHKVFDKLKLLEKKYQEL